MASAKASTGCVICLERKTASQTLEKKTKTVTSSNVSDKVARMILRERIELQILIGAGTDARGGRIQPLRHGQHSNHDLARGCDGHADRVFPAGNIDHRIVISLRGREDSRRERSASGVSLHSDSGVDARRETRLDSGGAWKLANIRLSLP